MLTRKTMARLYAEKFDMTISDAYQTIDSVIELLHDAIVNYGGVTISDFGTFKLIHKKERKGRNIKTHELQTIAEHDYPHFRAARKLVKEVNHWDFEQDAEEEDAEEIAD
ncbi:MAG: HU family DNA-binding protein [Lachnospiraceae bacterium]|nr:HU family DNA-binding protein [Lachnospiraceae bacterium]